MTKISNDTVYIVDTDVSDLDSLIGTDGNSTAKRTKNFLLGKLKTHFISGLSPLTGGVLRFTEITYSGELYATHAAVLNSLDPVFVVDQYHVVVVNLNGAKSILKLQNRSVGIDLPLVLTTDFITLSSVSNTSNSGNGAVILKPITQSESGSVITAKSISSTSLTITSTDNEISIEVPLVSDIPALIVNSAYTGIEELGTKSKPFKTIQSALDAYKGTGGRGTISEPTNPEKTGSIIEVEKGIGVYVFTGDFNYKDLYISLKDGAIVSSNPTSSWLMDFNAFGTTVTHNPIISFGEGAYLYLQKNGFRIVGGDFAPETNKRKTLIIKGKSTGLVLSGTIESDILFEVDGSNTQYANGGYLHLEVSTLISTNRGRMFVIKGNGVVTCESNLVYFLNDPSSTVITNTYPPIELRNNATLKFNNTKVVLGKTASVTYNQLIATYDSATFQAIDALFEGNAKYFAYNNTASNTATLRLDSCKIYIFTTTSFADTISGVWSNLLLNNNNMPNTTISSTVSIRPASINTIGNHVVEILNSYANRSGAIAAGLPTNAKFINRGGLLVSDPTTTWYIDILI